MNLILKNVVGKNAVAIRSYAEVTGVPEHIAKWMIDSNADDYMVKGEDYAFAWKQFWLFPSGIMWLSNKMDFKDYRILSEMVEQVINFEKDESGAIAVQKLAETVNQLREVQDALALSQETVANLVLGITSGTNKERPVTPEPPEYTEEEAEWVEKVNDVLKKKQEETGVIQATLLRVAYKTMRRNYGVVFEQLNKEYKEKFNTPSGTRIRTFDLIVHDPELRSILWGILGNIEEYVNVKANEEKKGA